MVLRLSDEIASGPMGLIKWLSKPPELLAMQTHESKTKVAPRGNAMVLKAKVAIEFTEELTDSRTWRASCRCLAKKPARGYPKK